MWWAKFPEGMARSSRRRTDSQTQPTSWRLQSTRTRQGSDEDPLGDVNHPQGPRTTQAEEEAERGAGVSLRPGREPGEGLMPCQEIRESRRYAPDVTTSLLLCLSTCDLEGYVARSFII